MKPVSIARAGAALVLTGAMTAAFALPAQRFFEKTAPSVWRVIVYDADGIAFAQGSGVVVAKETLLTNCHVLAKAKRIAVKQDNASYDARLQHLDLVHDMCQITARNLPAPAVELGNSDKLSVGQAVYALGNPRGLELTLSNGLISALRKDDNGNLFVIQTTAPISPGSSGGGLFDDDGRLIGLTTMVLKDSQNLNFAVPINWLRDLPARSAATLAQAKVPVPARADERQDKRAEQKPAPHVEPPPAPRADPAPAPKADDRPAPAAKPTAPTAPAARAATTATADINDLRFLDNYRPSVRTAYLEFLKRPLPRAFALSDNGGSYQAWGRVARDPNDSPDPAVRVISGCEKFHQSRCRLYVVDETVVYKPGP
jgi:serine protease Do